MKRIFLFLLVNVFVHMCSINTMAQMRPTFGTNTDLHNVEGNVKIIFGFNSGVGYDYGEKAFELYSTYREQSEFFPHYNQTILQITNTGFFNFRSVRDNEACSLNLLRGNTTYASMKLLNDNFALQSRGVIALRPGNVEASVATFNQSMIDFYTNLEVHKNSRIVRLGLDNANNEGWIGTMSNHGCYFGANSHSSIYCDTNYKVYIGGFAPSFTETIRTELKSNNSLFVKHGVLAEDLSIAPISSWADFVFQKDYFLRPLSEVEQFIKEEKHLPDVPSAQKLAEDGYSQHEMNKVLLQKVEELTLYVIELEKQVKDLKAKEGE